MWFLENWNQSAYNFLPQANAATNLTNRFPYSKWNELWILLEQTTNNPIQYAWSWILELSWSTTTYNTYTTNTKILKYNWDQLRFPLLTLWDAKYKAPEKCPTWFIWAPWDAQFNQKWFCVAKYEMSYADSYWDTPNSSIDINTWIADWNTVAYTWTKVPVSMAWKYPIADITQWQAIESCKSMWSWYHLITNNEWMSIARNIEQQPINWSWWVVWINYIFNWVSNWTSWCSNINLTSSTLRRWATTTWDSNCTWQRNKLTLSNGSQIWDLAWNVWEHVNKANTLDWTNSASWTTSISWSSNVIGWDDDWLYSTSDMYKYGSILWYWTSKWMWNLYYANWVANNNFFRGSSAFDGANAGVFTLRLSWNNLNWSWNVWFRCAR